MKRDPMAEIERAAQKARDREKKAAPKVESPDERARRHMKQKSALLRESLTGSPTVTFLDVVEGGFYFVLPFVVVAFTNLDLDQPAVIALLVLASPLSIFLGLTLRARAMAALRSLRIRRVGHGFDADRYLAQLSERRASAKLIVEVRFERPPDQELQRKASTLINGVRAEWKNGALKLESPALDGTGSVTSHGRVTRFFTNRPVHDCFTHVVFGVVPALSASNPVTRLNVEVTGETTSLEASA